VQTILQRDVIPRFKEDDYPAGILAGAQTLARAITTASSAKKSATGVAKPPTARKLSPDKKSWRCSVRQPQTAAAPRPTGSPFAAPDHLPTQVRRIRRGRADGWP
jgi:uncharacterized membrane protein YgcG